MNYKKEQRAKEVALLEENISEKQGELQRLAEKTHVQQSELDKYAVKLDQAKNRFEVRQVKEKFIATNARQYDDDPEFQLPEPKPLMSAKTYHEKIAIPLVSKLKDVIRSILLQFFEKTRELKQALTQANGQIESLSKRLKKSEAELAPLRAADRDYRRLRMGLGEDEADRIINSVKTLEIAKQQKKRSVKRDYVR